MNRQKSTPQQKRKRLLYVVIVLLALFALRLILLQTGVIAGPQPLSAEDLAKDFQSSQVQVAVGDTTARGTILQISTPSGLRRQSQHRTFYILTTAAVADAAQNAESAAADAADQEGREGRNEQGESEGSEEKEAHKQQEDAALDTRCTITFSDGSTAEGTYVSVNEAIGAGVISCTDENLDFAADSVFFSENILYQMAPEGSCYYQPESADTVSSLAASPVEGTFLTREASVEGYEIDMMEVQPAAGDTIQAGSGIFSDSGYFLGMALQTQSDGSVICLAGNNAVDYFRTNH